GQVVAAAVETDDRDRQERLEWFLHADGSGPRSAAAMWRREGLVQIEMDDVEVHLAGRGAAQDRVEVRPVVVEQAARVVHELGDVQNVFFEDPKGVRIRQHEGERLRTGGGLERFQVDPTIFRRDL